MPSVGLPCSDLAAAPLIWDLRASKHYNLNALNSLPLTKLYIVWDGISMRPNTAGNPAPGPSLKALPPLTGSLGPLYPCLLPHTSQSWQVTLPNRPICYTLTLISPGVQGRECTAPFSTPLQADVKIWITDTQLDLLPQSGIQLV